MAARRFRADRADARLVHIFRSASGPLGLRRPERSMRLWTAYRLKSWLTSCLGWQEVSMEGIWSRMKRS